MATIKKAENTKSLILCCYDFQLLVLKIYFGVYTNVQLKQPDPNECVLYDST